MANPLKTEHALDWSKTAQEIEDQFQAGMIERDRFRDALERIITHPYTNPAATYIAENALNPKP